MTTLGFGIVFVALCQCHASSGQQIYRESGDVLSLSQKDSMSTARQNVREELFGSVTTAARRPRLLYSQRWLERYETESGWRERKESARERVDSLMSRYVVCRLVDWWVITCWTYCNHMWDIHAAPAAPVLHVPLRDPSTGTTLPLSGCNRSRSQLRRTKLEAALLSSWPSLVFAPQLKRGQF